jgi:hypothetical protein
MLSGCSYRSYARMLGTDLWGSKGRAASLSSIQSPVFRPEMSGGLEVRSQSGAASSRGHFLPPARGAGWADCRAHVTASAPFTDPVALCRVAARPTPALLSRPPSAARFPFCNCHTHTFCACACACDCHCHCHCHCACACAPANSAAPWRPTCPSHARTRRPRPSMRRVHRPSLCQTPSGRIHLPRLPLQQTKTRDATARQSRTPLRPSASPHRTRPPRHSPWTSTPMGRCATPTRPRAHASYAPAQLARRHPYHGTMNPSTRPRQCRAPSRRALRTFRTS